MEELKNENEFIINEKYCLISRDCSKDNPPIQINPRVIEGFNIKKFDNYEEINLKIKSNNNIMLG